MVSAGDGTAETGEGTTRPVLFRFVSDHITTKMSANITSKATKPPTIARLRLRLFGNTESPEGSRTDERDDSRCCGKSCSKVESPEGSVGTLCETPTDNIDPRFSESCSIGVWANGSPV